MELEINGEIIKTEELEDYSNISSEVLDIIIYDMYYNLIYKRKNMEDIYTEWEIDSFYIFLHNYCNSIIKLKKTKAKFSQLLCLSFMIMEDQNYNKNIVENIFHKRIYNHFRNWYFYGKVSKRSMVTKIYYYIKTSILERHDDKFKKALLDIKSYYRYKKKLPEVLLLYDTGGKLIIKKSMNKLK